MKRLNEISASSPGVLLLGSAWFAWCFGTDVHGSLGVARSLTINPRAPCFPALPPLPFGRPAPGDEADAI